MAWGRAAGAVAGAALATALLVAAGAPAAASAPCGDPSARPWCDASLAPSERARLLLGSLTLAEKIDLMSGDDLVGVFTGDPAQGANDGVDRLGVPRVLFADGPVGVRVGTATALPASIGLAATFDPSLARRYGAVIGNEAHNKGIHVLHAPTINIMRTPLGGRTFEGFGEDPFLTSSLAVEYVRGVEGQGVIANVKHYAANNQETDRFVTNARVDERTLREIYLPGFEASVAEARVGSVMCAYNSVNGSFACENARLLREVLRGEWGFEGFVLTDYGFAQKSTGASARAGNDLEMPIGGWYSAPALRASLALGEVDERVIDDRVAAYLATLFRYGFFDGPPPPRGGEIDSAGHAEFARRVGEESMVLLRNEGGTLPLDPARVRSMAVVGPEADSYRAGGGSSDVHPLDPVSPLRGIRERAAREGIEVLEGAGASPGQAARLAGQADLAVVIVHDAQTEFLDKLCLTLLCGAPTAGDQDRLVAAVARANPRTVVVSQTGGPVLMPWRERVGAILQAWYPGQEGGHAIASVLFGDSDPGGRLPATFPVRERDHATAGDLSRYPGIALQARYDEGVFVGYRHYDRAGIEPAYPFGHGLSYTEFSYSGLRVVPAPEDEAPGAVDVGLTVRNSGSRHGTDVPQIYLRRPGREVEEPPRWLVGFQKVRLGPGEGRRVRIRVPERSLSHWDATAARWRVEPGCHELEAGRSSRDLRLRARFGRGGTLCSCEEARGFRRVSARPVGGGRSLRVGATRRVSRPFTVDVFRVAPSGRLRRVARVARRSGRAFTLRARGGRFADGTYVVRYRMGLGAGRVDTRRTVLDRRGGRFHRQADYHRRDVCGPIRSLKLRSPLVRRGSPVRLAVALNRSGRVRVELRRGGRVVRRLAVRELEAGPTHRLTVPGRGLRRGVHTVRVTVEAQGEPPARAVVATRLR